MLSTGRKHCKLVWDGTRTSIVDLGSVNGTWVSTFQTHTYPHSFDFIQVNFKRLADREVRILHDKDRISFTALPFDARMVYNSMREMFYDSTLGQPHALEFTYQEYAGEAFPTTILLVEHVVRRSLNELLRIRTVVRDVLEQEDGGLLDRVGLEEVVH